MTRHRYLSFFSSLVSTGELSSFRAGALISTDGWMEMISFESRCPGKRCLVVPYKHLALRGKVLTNIDISVVEEDS